MEAHGPDCRTPRRRGQSFDPGEAAGVESLVLTGQARTALPVLLAFAGLSALCRGEPRPADVALAALSAELSEPPGYFDTDNLISNESSYLQVADQLADAAPAGGVYIGVGPEQNFSYIARLRPRYAFILDVRRGNLLQHLLFAALFARADDPYHYLCLLFSRPCPSGPPRAPLGGERTAALDTLPPPSEAAFESNLRAAYRHIEGTLRFALTAPDRDHIHKISRAFFEEQVGHPLPELRASRGQLPADLPDACSRRGARAAGSGASSNRRTTTRFVRDLSRRNHIIPVVGSFAGPHALRAIGGWMRARGLSLSAFYTSNVEFYLLRDQALRALRGQPARAAERARQRPDPRVLRLRPPAPGRAAGKPQHHARAARCRGSSTCTRPTRTRTTGTSARWTTCADAPFSSPAPPATAGSSRRCPSTGSRSLRRPGSRPKRR